VDAVKGFGPWEVHQAGPGWLLVIPAAAVAVVVYEVVQDVIVAALVVTGCACALAAAGLVAHLRRELRVPTGIHVRPVKSIRESRNVRTLPARAPRAIESRVVQGVVVRLAAGDEKVSR
jgi:hypothetical protein